MISWVAYQDGDDIIASSVSAPRSSYLVSVIVAAKHNTVGSGKNTDFHADLSQPCLHEPWSWNTQLFLPPDTVLLQIGDLNSIFGIV